MRDVVNDLAWCACAIQAHFLDEHLAEVLVKRGNERKELTLFGAAERRERWLKCQTRVHWIRSFSATSTVHEWL